MVSEILENGAGHRDPVRSSRKVVLKFGGTSIGKFAPAVAEICLSSLAEYPIAVVCSARSGRSKAEGTTNLLLKAVREASRPGSQKYEAVTREILRDHCEAAQNLEATGDISKKTAESLIRDFTLRCEELKAFLSTLTERGGVTPEVEDEVVSVGEKLSALLLVGLLEGHGQPAEYIDLSNIIDFESPSGLDPNFFKRVAEAVGRRVTACGNRVPIVTGFFGRVPGGLLKNCGRGYSDLLAALVAVGVDSQELQVWKEVSGVYTADPKKVPTAQLLPSIHFMEAEELTFFGSEVLHHFTVEQCVPKIPIRIKNVNEPHGAGTVIVVSDVRRLSIQKGQTPKKPTAVTSKESITIVNVHSNRKVCSPEFLARICATLDKYALQVDLFELNEMHVSLAVHCKTPFIMEAGRMDDQETKSQIRDLELCIKELGEYGTVNVKHDMAIISLIGRELKQSIGIAGRFFTALGKSNINIEMISQGASEINISCVISGHQALRAINVVHTDLFTFLD